jgi:hypothetical protein
MRILVLVCVVLLLSTALLGWSDDLLAVRIAQVLDYMILDPNNSPNTMPLSGIEAARVPNLAAFWLFGSALIGFVGISRRTIVA